MDYFRMDVRFSFGREGRRMFHNCDMATIIILGTMLKSVLASLAAEKTHIITDHLPEHSSNHDFEITIPSFFDHEGNPVSYDFIKYHNYPQTRWKRDTNHHSNKEESYHHSNQKHHKATLNVNITGFGKSFQLKLWQNKKLLAPGFKVYRRGSQNSDEVDSGQTSRMWEETQCHYSGTISDQDNGAASVSLCEGMKGIIRTTEEDYIIEPIQRHKIRKTDRTNGNAQQENKAANEGIPHKIYKRSSLGVNQQKYCGKQFKEKRSVYNAEDNSFTETADGHHSIHKRSPFQWRFQNPKLLRDDKTVETLVVVDKKMYYRHGDQNITTYTLTLFNMVMELYRDTSLGHRMDIVLVGLILLEGDEPGLNIGYHADKTLNSFCSWQSVIVGGKGRQHDHAILLTGLDLCSYKNAPCDTLGFAPIEGMCNRIRSCTINEDTGLSTAFTIAHEMGHNFGMFHDGEGNYCTQSAGKIMSPTLMGKDGQFHWSICSKAYLMRFLNTPQSKCLTNKPKKVAELRFPDKLPGELYNADVQCKWQFGHRAKLCTYDFGKDICKSLWCYRGKKRCETKFLPAAEGTSCGAGMWCRQGECVKFGQDGPEPIDGAWSDWTLWSECSRSCGGGVMFRERECNRPLPQYGGHPCLGDEKVFKMCNVQECPNGDADFFTVQCSAYDKKPFQGWYLSWKPNKKLLNVKEPCKLHCIAETYNYVFTIKHIAVDGMKCVDDKSICVEGVCKPIGCDWIVGSNSSNDACGVCKGDNSTCRRIKGEYTEQPKLNSYFPVAILPKTARSIKIKEKSLTSNYIAIRDIYGKYFLNGQHRVAWPGEYTLAGAKFFYRRPYNEPESLYSKGPLQEDLVLEILVQDKNPGISYEYYMPWQGPKSDTSDLPSQNYTWSISVSSCTEPCAGGKKTVTAICHRNIYEEADPENCDIKQKPKSGVFPCNLKPCPPRWVPEEWKECTRTCGGGRQKRKIYCRQRISQEKDKKLKRSNCKHLPKPIRSRRCNEQECPPDWHAGKWSKCSVSCGEGERTRKISCRQRQRRGFKVMSEDMCQEPRPEIVKTCRKGSCPVKKNHYHWHISPWGPCSKTCGNGTRSRYLRCRKAIARRKFIAVNSTYCVNILRPSIPMKEACQVMLCPQQLVWSLHWQVSLWSQCSVTCGEGEQRRRVQCVDHKGKEASGCSAIRRPAASQRCRTGIHCPKSRNENNGFCMDKYTWCHLVPEHNFCGHEFYGTNCCKTCQVGR